MHLFSSSHGSSFRCRLGHNPGRNGAENMCVQCQDLILSFFKDSVNHFEASDIKFMRSRSKGSNKHHFSGYASSFPRLFGHYSGRNGAANMFVQRHNVSLRLSKGSYNHFLA